MGYMTIEDLMVHLRNEGIAIDGDVQRRQLINTGYFHGYKGYRFFGKAQNRIPFISYDEVYATIRYDSQLKALMYEKIMFIETAVKNIALESILRTANSESVQDMCNTVVMGYHNSPAGASTEEKRKLQQNKLNLQHSIQSSLALEYRRNNPKITHYYNKLGSYDVPVWALFEIMTLGDLGRLLSCLTYDVRDDISKGIGINVSSDTDRQLVYKYVYLLKDLRNAIAHNSAVFDTRFLKFNPSASMKQCLMVDVGLPYINFRNIGDYIILIGYYMKLLKTSDLEIITFIDEFEVIIDNYRKSVNQGVSKMVVHPDVSFRMNVLKKFI